MFEIISSIKACLFLALRDRVWKIQWQSVCSCQESTLLKLTVKIGDQFSKKLLHDLFCQWKSTGDDSGRNVHGQSFFLKFYSHYVCLPSPTSFLTSWPFQEVTATGDQMHHLWCCNHNKGLDSFRHFNAYYSFNPLPYTHAHLYLFFLSAQFSVSAF